MMKPRLTWTQAPAGALDNEPEVRDSWNRLNALGLGTPFMDASVVGTALRCFGRGDERVFSAARDGETVAMFVLRRAGPGRWETFQPSQLPLGVFLMAPDMALDDTANQLLRHALWPSLALSLTQVDPLCAARPAETASTRVDDYIDTAWIDLEGSFDEYWAQRGKNLRSNMRKQRNKLAADGVVSSLLIYDKASDMAAAVSRYGLIESSGWKAAEGTAIHPDNEQGRFYRELLETAARRGEAVVYEYRFDDQPVAMHLCLRRAGQLVILKTTYDETIDRSLSPALLLHQDELQDCFGGGAVRRVEYYGRIMEWHTRWTENRRTLYHLTCYRWQWLKRLKQQLARSAAEPAAAARDKAPAESES